MTGVQTCALPICTLLPVKAVREAVVETLLEWHDQFVTVSFSDGDASPVPAFRASLSYIPQGFTLVEASDPAATQFYYAQYADDSGGSFDVIIAPINASSPRTTSRALTR